MLVINYKHCGSIKHKKTLGNGAEEKTPGFLSPWKPGQNHSQHKVVLHDGRSMFQYSQTKDGNISGF